MEVHVGAGGAEAAVAIEGEARAIGVFVGVEEDVFAIVLVVAPSRQGLSISCGELTLGHSDTGPASVCWTAHRFGD